MSEPEGSDVLFTSDPFKGRTGSAADGSADPSATKSSCTQLSKLLQEFPVVRSTAAIQIQASKDLKKPFETIEESGGKFVALPSNIKELLKEDYLINLYLQVLEKSKYELIMLETTFTSKFKLTSTQLTWLKAFGILPVTGTLPELPKTKGVVYRGIISSISCYADSLREFDSSLFIFRNADKPALEVFGDVWGKNYPEHKRMLDFLIHHIRMFDKDHFNLYPLLLPKETIAQEKGLNLDISSQVLSENEIDFIKSYLKSKNITVTVDMSVFDKSKVAIEASAIFRLISERQKSIRPIKDFIKRVTSERVKACYDQFSDKQRKSKKVRETPIRDLAEQLKGSIGYAPFNPTMVVSLTNDLVPLPSRPPKEDEMESYDAQVNDFGVSLERKGVKKQLILNLIEEYKQYSANLLEE